MTDPVMLLSQLHGEGRVTFRALRTAGFYTLASIAHSPVQTLADRAHLSARTARRLKTGAEELMGKGVDLETHQPEGSRPPRGAGVRAGGKRAGAAAEIPFSEGVLLEEAALLGQGQVDVEPPPDPVVTAAPEPGPSPPPPSSRPRRTFWGFG